MKEAIYLLDEANGMYTDFFRRRVPIQVYIGPFETMTDAVAYLSSMAGFSQGKEIPEGYAIIKMVQPMPGWADLPEPPTFRKEARKLKYDMKLRYDQTKKIRSRKKK